MYRWLGLLVMLTLLLAVGRPTSPVATPPARYVDAAVTQSGDGLSWATAWKTLSEAAQAQVAPGTVVHIRPGVYHETVMLTGSGEAVVSIRTGISVGGDRVTFPPGTDLAGIDLVAHPGEYYVYVARSLLGNHGVFPLIAVDVAARQVQVAGATFRAENGIVGDAARLSAAIGRPVIYRNAAADPTTERVILDASQDAQSCTVLYIGGYIDPYHATPANFNIVDGLDITGSQTCGGIHLQNSSFNVIQNGRIYNHQGGGILLDGSDTPAQYNYVCNTQVWNTPDEAIYIGAGGHDAAYNHTDYNHILGNELFVQGPAANARLENAVDVKEHNVGNVIAGNLIHDFNLVTAGNGALDIRDGAHYTLVYGNTFRNIGRVAGDGTYYVLNVYPEVRHVWIYNNLIYRTVPYRDGVFALNVHGNQTEDVRLAHNTVHGMDAGLLLQYSTPGGDGNDNGVLVANTLFSEIAGTLLEEWTWDSAAEGTFALHHNIFPRAPGGYAVPAEFIGIASFVDAAGGNFRLTGGSVGLDQGAVLTPAISLDFDTAPRDATPDVGAFEYQLPSHWLYLPLVLRNFTALDPILD